MSRQATARHLAAMVADAPGRGMRRDELAAALGTTWPELWPAAGLAYRMRLVDFCRDFIVASPLP